MATPLDLQEQEQLDALKAFWKQYGNLITTVLLLAALAYAGWNGWAWYQRDQANKATGLFEAVESDALAGNADAAAKRFAVLRDAYPGTAHAAQAGLLAARVLVDKEQTDAAQGVLGWVAGEGQDAALRNVARLRLAALHLHAGEHDKALAQLDAVDDNAFAAAAADRRGDVLMAAGKADEARAAYEKAYAALDASVEYRRLVEAKLTALGAAPQPQGESR